MIQCSCGDSGANVVAQDQRALRHAERPADLPEFDAPPLVECVLGIQFAELREYRTIHAGLLWEKTFRNNGFPKFLEQPPVPKVFETFGGRRVDLKRLEISRRYAPNVPRLWFINEAETELIQIQADRFLHNWRKIGGQPYPRFESIRKSFFKEVQDVESFFQCEGVGSIDVNQCELTYVNHIEISDFDFYQPSRIFRVFSQDADFVAQNHKKILQLEDIAFTQTMIIADAQSKEPRGRLHLEAQGLTQNDNNVVRFTLTARGAPASPSLQAVSDFMHDGRVAIVQAFTQITTDEMHVKWKRNK